MKFHYELWHKKNEEKITGVLRADSYRSALAILKNNDVVIIKLKKYRMSVHEYLNGIHVFSVSRSELIVFMRELASMLKNGNDLVASLVFIKESVYNKQLKSFIEDIKIDLEKGLSLSVAMSKFTNIFPKEVLTMIKMGEQTNVRLGNAFFDACAFLEYEHKVRSKIRAAFSYPMLVMFFVFGAILLINVYVIPPFKMMFESWDIELPWNTKILIYISDLMINYWHTVLIGIALAVIMFNAWASYLGGQRYIDIFKLKVPFVNNILIKVYYARFTKNFAITLKSGMTHVEALDVEAPTIGNIYFAEKIIIVNKKLMDTGVSLHMAMKKVQIFSPLILETVMISEGDYLSENLYKLSETYDDEWEYSLQKFTEILSPILLMMIGGVILFVALGVFVPIWSFSSNVNI